MGHRACIFAWCSVVAGAVPSSVRLKVVRSARPGGAEECCVPNEGDEVGAMEKQKPWNQRLARGALVRLMHHVVVPPAPYECRSRTSDAAQEAR